MVEIPSFPLNNPTFLPPSLWLNTFYYKAEALLFLQMSPRSQVNIESDFKIEINVVWESVM